MATLIVIDMQNRFLNYRHKDLIDRIINLVNVAKENKDNIILVEYGCRWEPEKPAQRTVKKIQEAVKGYNKLYRVKKFDDAGGDKVIECMNEQHLHGPIIACGVNTSCCVKETVEELVNDFGMTVTVVANCCKDVFDNSEYSHFTAHGTFNTHETLQVVDTPEDAYELIEA